MVRSRFRIDNLGSPPESMAPTRYSCAVAATAFTRVFAGSRSENIPKQNSVIRCSHDNTGENGSPFLALEFIIDTKSYCARTKVIIVTWPLTLPEPQIKNCTHRLYMTYDTHCYLSLSGFLIHRGFLQHAQSLHWTHITAGRCFHLHCPHRAVGSRECLYHSC